MKTFLVFFALVAAAATLTGCVHSNRAQMSPDNKAFYPISSPPP
jgi:hypothetical protein